MDLDNKIPYCKYEQLGRSLYENIEKSYSIISELNHKFEVCDFDSEHHLKPNSKLTFKTVQYINSNMIFKYSISFQYKNVDFVVNIFKMDYETIDECIEQIKRIKEKLRGKDLEIIESAVGSGIVLLKTSYLICIFVRIFSNGSIISS